MFDFPDPPERAGQLLASRLSRWYPRVAALFDRLNLSYMLPRTTIVQPHSACDLRDLLDGERPFAFDGFVEALQYAGSFVGYPFFLRHDLGAAKHGYKHTCLVSQPSDVASHVAAIVDHTCAYAECDGVDVWAVRELLPVDPEFYAFDGLPIAREVRFIVDRGRVDTFFPYWPVDAFRRDYTKVFADGDIEVNAFDDSGRRLAHDELVAGMAKVVSVGAQDVGELARLSADVAADLVKKLAP